MKLPTVVRLGRGYKVKVRLAGAKRIKQLLGCEGVGCWADHLHEAKDGIIGVIYIDKGLPEAEQWDTYWHELIHAINDVSLWDRENVWKS